jgi:hypothetical protein
VERGEKTGGKRDEKDKVHEVREVRRIKFRRGER